MKKTKEEYKMYRESRKFSRQISEKVDLENKKKKGDWIHPKKLKKISE